MKLKPPQRFSSFYESFSDLIFGTMAIFVLLMMVFLSMVNQAKIEEQKKLKEKVVEQSQEIQKIKTERDKTKEQLEELIAKFAKLEDSVRARGVEIVIAVDVSASMPDSINSLQETISTLAKVLPKITPHLSIGIVAYRQNISGENDNLKIFPLSDIHREEKDDGQSFNKLYTYLHELKAESGAAPVTEAVKKSIQMLRESKDSNVNQVFLLLGDVGPYEILTKDNNYEIVADINQRSQLDEEMYSVVKSWVNSGPSKSVISIFAFGKDFPLSDPKNVCSSLDNEPSNHARFANLEHDKGSCNFFRNVSGLVGQPQNFTNNNGKMLALILDSIVINE